jgi:transcriptional pleiotropic repressor
VKKLIVSPLLEKTRRINKILQKTAGQRVDFLDVAEVLKTVIHANIYIVDREGYILGYALVDEFECEIMIRQVLKNEEFPERYNQLLLRNDETRVNLTQKKTICVSLLRKKAVYLLINSQQSFLLWVAAKG